MSRIGVTLPEENAESFDYSGRETLGDMTLSHKYNNYLVREIQERYSNLDTVLDFGAGNGHFLKLLQSKTAKFLALEPDRKLQTEIKAKSVAEVIEQDQLLPKSVNLIYTLNVLEHIEDDQGILGLFYNWLDEGGMLLVYVPAIPHLYSKFDASIGHFRRYKKSELKEKLMSAGFETLDIRFIDPLGYFLALAYKLFFNTGQVKSTQIEFFDRFIFPASRVLSFFTKSFFGKNLIAVAIKRS